MVIFDSIFVAIFAAIFATGGGAGSAPPTVRNDSFHCIGTETPARGALNVESAGLSQRGEDDAERGPEHGPDECSTEEDHEQVA